MVRGDRQGDAESPRRRGRSYVKGRSLSVKIATSQLAHSSQQSEDRDPTHTSQFKIPPPTLPAGAKKRSGAALGGRLEREESRGERVRPGAPSLTREGLEERGGGKLCTRQPLVQVEEKDPEPYTRLETTQL